MTNIRTIMLQLAIIKTKIKNKSKYSDLNLNEIQITLDKLEGLAENSIEDNIGNNEEVDRFVEEPIKEEIKLDEAINNDQITRE